MIKIVLIILATAVNQIAAGQNHDDLEFKKGRHTIHDCDDKMKSDSEMIVFESLVCLDLIALE